MQDKRRLIMIYAIARGMDDMTKQSLFQASGLGPEDYPLIDNLSMLGVPMSRVGVETGLEHSHSSNDLIQRSTLVK